MKSIYKLLVIFFLLASSEIYAQTIVTDVYSVQQDTALLGQEVAVVGIVTVTTGIFDVRRTFIEDSRGGAWSAVAVWDQAGEFYAEEGERVRVIGTVTETNGLTEILVNNHLVFVGQFPLPDTIEVNSGDIATGSSIAESYESVLIQLNNVSVVNDSLDSGEWLVDDGSGTCRIDDAADFLQYEIPGIGTTITSITGILNYSNGDFKLEPRYRSDIIDGDSSYIYTIQQIQQNSSLVGQTVTIDGIITAGTGIFHPNKSFIEEPDGGPFSGILLYDSTASMDVQEGDYIQVHGEVSENAGMTEIVIDSYEILSIGHPLPAMAEVKTGDISSDSENAELYEGVLVQVNDVYVFEENLGNGIWEVNSIEGACNGLRESCTIGIDAQDMVFQVPQMGTGILSISGILVNDNNGFRLEPRYSADIITMAADPIGDTLTIVQRPILNIPSIIEPGDTLEIICDITDNPSTWTATLMSENYEVFLTPVDQEFIADKQLWKLKAIIPQNILYQLYDLKLELMGEETDISGNSVYIIPHFKNDFYFIHITDTHLPTDAYCRDGNYQEDSSEVVDIREVIKDINLINPEFVLHTGDLIHEGELEDYINNRYFTKTQEVLSELTVPLYLVPGNHDLGGWDDTPMPDGTARRNWWRFFWVELSEQSSR